MKNSKVVRRSRSKRAQKKARTEILRAPKAYHALKFKNVKTLTKSLAKVKMTSTNISQMLDAAHSHSVTRAKTMIRAMASTGRHGKETNLVLDGILRWGGGVGPPALDRRKVVIESLKVKEGGVLLVHGISRLARNQAIDMMKVYFKEGGTMAPIMQWLEMAGRAMQDSAAGRLPANRVSKSFLGDVWDAIKSAGESMVNAVSNLVDAVESAGKSLVRAIADAISFTFDQVKNLVRALVSIGKSVVSILEAALSNGLLALYIKALHAIGRTVSEVLNWAINKVSSVIQQSINALLAAGAALLSLVSWALNQSELLLRKAFSAMLAAGKTIASIMTNAVRLAGTLIKKAVGALMAIGQTIGNILKSIASSALSILQTVVEGLLAAGATLVQIVAGVCADVVAGFRKGFFQGLMALGKAVVDILKAAAMTSLAILGLALAVVLEIFGGYRQLTAHELREARKVFGYSIDLERVKVAVNSMPVDAINYLNNERPFTTMYLINFASWAHVTIPTLIHELTHVWQATTRGPIYMVEALHSQSFGRGYEITEPELDAAQGDITKLETEQQAVVVETYWRGAYGGENVPLLAKIKILAACVYRQKPMGIPFPRPFPITLPVIGRRPVAKRFYVHNTM